MKEGSRLTVFVAGMVAGVPRHGGATWAVLQYVLGLRDLGHDVWVVEPVAEEPSREVTDYFEQIRRAFGLEERSAILLPGRRAHGVPYHRLTRAAERAGLLLNIAGMLQDPELLERIPIRLYLDLDPGFTQLWSEVEGIDLRFDGHTHLATVGLEVGRSGCPVPTCGRTWIRTVPPVVLDEWPQATRVERDALTTIGNWRAYGSIEHEGVFYGQKAHAWRELIELPARVSERFELALSIHHDEQCDLRALAEHGWVLLDPDEMAGSPEAYRRFIAGSMAEVGVAKSGYVHSRCGWFSDRSVCYLASGRPVLAQDTGFSAHLPTGLGLLAFDSCDEAVAGVHSIRRDYAAHARAARQIAEEHFRHDRVLPTLLKGVGAG
jgi:hypothetical protein